MLIIINGGSHCDRVCALIQKPTEEISVATIIIVERNTLRQYIIIIHAEHTDYNVPHVSYASGDTMPNESCVRVPITYKLQKSERT